MTEDNKNIALLGQIANNWIHQNNMVTNHINWLITIQTLLFLGYPFSIELEMNYLNGTGIAFIGFIIGIIMWLHLENTYEDLTQIRKRFESISNENDDYNKMKPWGVNKKSKSSRCLIRILFFFFVFAWALIIILRVI